MRTLLVVACLGALAPAQQLVRLLNSFDFSQRFTPMGDVDGDGYEDALVVSEIYVGPYPSNYDYELRIYSGRDGTLLRRGPRWSAPDLPAVFPTGDHDGDGFRDYILRVSDSANATYAMSVRSGRDDHVFWSIQQPYSVDWGLYIIGDLDVDGDHQLDVVVAHPLGTVSRGDIWAYDHYGNLLYHLVGTPWLNSLAQSLAKLGDVNGDGCDDYVSGLGDPNWFGAVAVISGRDGQFLRVVTGQNFLDYIGYGAVGCGDLDGDGLPDFAAGGGLSGSWGSVQAFSGATGQRLFATYSGRMGDWFGAKIRAADYDQDGIQDILVASHPGGYVISGRDGSIMPTTMANWGILELQPFATPDGFPNVIVRTPAQSYLVRGQPFHTRIIGQGCSLANPPAIPPQLGLRELNGLDRRISLSGGDPGSGTFLLLGLADQPGNLNLGAVGFPRCTIYPDLAAIGFFATGTGGNTAGYTSHDFQVPGPSAFGRGIDAQWLTLDGNGAPSALSRAMRFAISH